MARVTGNEADDGKGNKQDTQENREKQEKTAQEKLSHGQEGCVRRTGTVRRTQAINAS